ncbi:hypothetical protein U27_06451 [Candidatus Vecturithrix granuli]|uniref:DUF547 domain-containing protein n=1 Tax=Vecturithrix granuli TaxID=1499967 RepID=A0A081C4G1_VECG1|nr:hypothetical protein U27_06451 [Candidatus Vecturithrix granuli]
MLIPKGQAIHEHLSTSFTHIEQLVEGLRKKRFSGYCHLSFWEYDGIAFFHEGQIVNAQEKIGMQGTQVQTGDLAIAHFLEKAREKDGNISVYQLAATTVATLMAAMNVTSKYESLSTDLTSLDRLIALLQKEHLTGYIEILLEQEAGIANLFFANGGLIEILLASPDDMIIGESTTIGELNRLCQEVGAVFNVYQTTDIAGQAQEGSQTKAVSPQMIKLFEAILARLESATNALLKEGGFQAIFKTILPQIADTYPFLDPFIGDFRYVNGALSFEGNTPAQEFVTGMCEAINATIKTLLQSIPRHLFLAQLSRHLESVATEYADLVDQWQFEMRLPEIFRDYTFLQDTENDAEAIQKGLEVRKVLNLQGIGFSEIDAESILKEFYRVMALIVENHTELEGKTIAYAQLKKSREYQQYQTAIAFLQQLGLASLKTYHDRLAFWINLYNFLVIDAVLKSGIKTSVQDVKSFFMKASYRLGDYVFSLDDIEHGILRNNQCKPYSGLQQFQATDPRRQFCLAPLDARIHCCMTCAAQSAPPLAIYTPQGLDEQLDRAVTRYLLNGGMRFERTTQELWLSRTFYWYRKDFENGGRTFLDVVLQALRNHDIGRELQASRAKLTVRFMDYDWKLNGK